MTWKYVERAASLATIAAFLMAAYAFIFPAALSDFLDKISKSNAKLADEIPHWLLISDSYDKEILGQLGSEGAAFAIPLENRGNFNIRDISVRVFNVNGVLVSTRDSIFLAPFGGYTLYDVAPTGSFLNGMVTCISGYSERANKFLYEKRVMSPEGIAGLSQNYTTDYVFTDEGWPDGCQV